MRRQPVFTLAASLTAGCLLLTACGEGGDAPAEDPDPAATSADEELAVAIASYDLAVGEDQRLLAGVLSNDAVQIAFGEVDFQLGYLGEDPSGEEVDLTDPVAASYLPVPGLAPEGEPAEQPTLLVGRSGTGVYEGEVDLAEPGFYGLRVEATLADGTTREGQATFEVRPEPEVPAVGDEAPRSDNLTIADVEAGDAPAIALDSRAQEDDAEIPDPILHDSTVAEAIEAGTPSVVALTTPTYCQSVFCGPLTTELADLAPAYEGEVDFIQIEVWGDFEARELNEAAAEWIQTEAGGNEPWVFLVDGDGTIQARWDNVLDLPELETRLAEL